MYLSLCLNCSKDFIEIRSNPAAWKAFIAAVKKQDVTQNETITIPIGNKELTFTSTHLAEIQAILEIEELEEK